ncbi:HIT family protein [Chitinibacter bivalviorum]|uniref:HIT family protein n=1 Tax=Chitinibacter bivalviorum TaxID=2739434 RepID=A0A7H9BHR8_9NEIS|nr:HIT family protein [Chitinibacter bivalviorum]QLG87084.1 HIT family protein [Chitinibacter bivalviorum]
MNHECALCHTSGEDIVWQNKLARVIMVNDAQYPGFCRVILNRHQAEMTDLNAAERLELMNIVWAVESVQRAALNPTKINLASLGNMVPHVHWHIIPRWHDDPHFPAPIWAQADPMKTPHGISQEQLAQLRAQLEQLKP